MDNDGDKINEIQSKLTSLVNDRQIQISELKRYYDCKNQKLYKDIVLINHSLFEEVYPNKQELRNK